MSGKSAEAGGSVLKGSVHAPVFVPGKDPAGKAAPANNSQAPGKQGAQQTTGKGAAGKGNSGWAAAVAQTGVGAGAGNSAKLSATAASAPVFVPKTGKIWPGCKQHGRHKSVGGTGSFS